MFIFRGLSPAPFLPLLTFLLSLLPIDYMLASVFSSGHRFYFWVFPSFSFVAITTCSSHYFILHCKPYSSIYFPWCCPQESPSARLCLRIWGPPFEDTCLRHLARFLVLETNLVFYPWVIVVFCNVLCVQLLGLFTRSSRELKHISFILKPPPLPPQMQLRCHCVFYYVVSPERMRPRYYAPVAGRRWSIGFLM